MGEPCVPSAAGIYAALNLRLAKGVTIRATEKPHELTMISIPLDKMSLAEKLEAMEAR